MAEPFLAEIRIASFNFAPQGWALANGQFLPINQNQALFSLMGTVYGGNGMTTFALPDLRGRTPIHMGNGFTLGQRAGEENHTLTPSEMPAHNHPMIANTGQGTTSNPTNDLLSAAQGQLYTGGGDLAAMSPSAVANYGGSQAHNNMAPSLVLNFIVALQGIFPSQT